MRTTSVASGDEFPRGFKFYMEQSIELTFEELVNAYFDCRKGKRKSIHAVAFEFELEKNLFDLYEDLISGNYKISRSIAFVVEQPKIREIWAATFRDRVIHHVIYNRLSPRFYPSFIRNSFACIPGRGTLDGSNHLWAGMRSITRNWNQSAYYLQGDVRSFFVSINKAILFDLLKPRIKEQWLYDLTQQVLFHDPKENCFRKSKEVAFSRVPAHKSLWKSPRERGLPIGNLTSQFFANVYLDVLDQFVKHTLRAKYYYRYVDDFVILDPCPKKLNEYFTRINEFCKEKLVLDLHPFKKRIAPIEQGIDFIGFVHKPYYRRLRGRTVAKMVSLVHQWEKSHRCYEQGSLIKLRSSMNSYMGLAKWASTYRLRKYLGDRVDSLFIYPDKNYRKLIIGEA